MVNITFLVCVFAVLLDILISKNIFFKENKVLFCGSKVYGKFVDHEISIDYVEFRIMK